MQLDELKRNMSVLDQVLSKTSTDIRIDVRASETAREKLMKRYRQNILSNSIIAIVFASQIGNSSFPLPVLYVAFITAITGLAALWYIFLFIRLKDINISRMTPTRLFSETAKIKIMTLSGEVFFAIALAVFFTLLLSDLLVTSQLAFWLIIGCLAAGIAGGIFYFWPRYIKLFRDLTTLKD